MRESTIALDKQDLNKKRQHSLAACVVSWSVAASPVRWGYVPEVVF